MKAHLFSLAVLLLSGSAFAQKGAPAVDLAATPLPQHLATQSLDEGFLGFQHLAPPATPDAPFVLPLQLEGQALTVRLHRSSMRAADFETYQVDGENRRSAVDAGPVRTVIGTVDEDKDAIVAGSLLATGFEAVIELSGGRRLSLQPHYESFLLGDRQTFVLSEDAAPAAATSCGVTEPPVPVTSSPLGLPACGGDYCVARLALDCDVAFRAHWNGSTSLTLAQAEFIALVANIQYIRDVEIRHVLAAIFVRTTDPAEYVAASNRGELLVAVRSNWNNFWSGISRDLCHLLTGRFSGGQAYVGVVCDQSAAYGVNCTTNPRGVSCIANVLAHEMGHNWNAGHCDCDGNPNPSYTMHESFPPCALRFNPANTVDDIRAFRDSRTCLVPGVINDRREDAIEVSNNQLVEGDTRNATDDGLSNCGGDASADVWFKFRPATNGNLQASTCSSSTTFDTVLVVVDAAGSILDCDDDVACSSANNASSVNAIVFGGETYWIRVAGFGGSTGEFGLSIIGPPSRTPLNDRFEDAQWIGPGVYNDSTAAATPSSSVSVCGLSSSSDDVWYRYTPRRSYTLTVDTCRADFPTSGGSIIDTVVSLHDENGATLACNDDFCNRGSRVEYAVTSGETYWIRVAGYNGASGGFRMSVSGPSPDNAECGSPVDIDLGTHYSTLQGAYGTEEAPTCFPVQPDLFYRYTNDTGCDGTLVVSTCGTNDLEGEDLGVDTVLSLHTGCPADDSTLLGCSDDNPACTDSGQLRDSSTSLFLAQGDSVLIRVSRYSLVNGDQPFLLSLDLTPGTPVNDLCANAIPVIHGGTYFGTMCGANAEGGGATCGLNSEDVWYTYTALETGELIVSTCGSEALSGINTVLSLHSDALCPGTAGTTLACSDVGCGSSTDALVTEPVVAGQTVLIRVATPLNLFDGSFVLNVDFELGTPFCTANVNSSGDVARISAAGSTSLAVNNLRLRVEGAPANRPGLFYLGPNAVNTPFGEGRRCVGGQTKRILPIATTNSSGTVTRQLDYTRAYGSGIFVGSPGVKYQFWFRDPGFDGDGDGTAEGFNLSDAIAIEHRP